MAKSGIARADSRGYHRMMNARRNYLPAAAGVWLLLMICGPPAAGEDGRALLEEVMDRPGAWSQLCAPLDPTPFDAPLPIFSSSLVERYFGLGRSEAAKLRNHRADAVAALTKVLAAMDLTKPPPVTREPAGADGGVRAGFKLAWLNHLHLEIVREFANSMPSRRCRNCSGSNHNCTACSRTARRIRRRRSRICRSMLPSLR
jgi:hypothetical protein